MTSTTRTALEADRKMVDEIRKLVTDAAAMSNEPMITALATTAEIVVRMGAMLDERERMGNRE